MTTRNSRFTRRSFIGATALEKQPM